VMLRCMIVWLFRVRSDSKVGDDRQRGYTSVPFDLGVFKDVHCNLIPITVVHSIHNI
jgi:hypothetical protein